MAPEMPERAPSPERLAELYDVFNPWGPGDDFYLGLVMAAQAVLDVGCGTGGLLRRAREAGHTGRLCGLDPDEAMLSRARRRPDVEWAGLRFLDADALASFLADAGFTIQEQFGDWDRPPLTATSPEIITLARRTS